MTLTSKVKTCLLIIALSIYPELDIKAQNTNNTLVFSLPEIPSILTSPEARADYIVTHYWDKIDFNKTIETGNKDVIEQAWVDYCDVLNYVPLTTAQKAIKSTISNINQNKINFKTVTDLADKYLYNPNSPMRNEEFYIPVLEAMSESPMLTQAEKIAPKARLRLAHKNRVGTQAIDFTYTIASGKQQTLYNTKAKYIIVFFNNPGCHACTETIEELKSATFLNNLLNQGQLSIISFYPDEELDEWKKHYKDFSTQWINSYDLNQTVQTKTLYDLKAIPTLYLLDANKKVLLKDATTKAIEQYLSRDN